MTKSDNLGRRGATAQQHLELSAGSPRTLRPYGLAKIDWLGCKAFRSGPHPGYAATRNTTRITL